MEGRNKSRKKRLSPLSALDAAREEIRSTCVDGNARFEAVLRYLEKNIFHPQLDVNRLKRDCGIGDGAFSTKFRRVVGTPPRAYIESIRLKIAHDLLTDSFLGVPFTAYLVGYSSLPSFKRAFRRKFGFLPTSGERLFDTLRRKRRSARWQVEAFLIFLIFLPSDVSYWHTEVSYWLSCLKWQHKKTLDNRLNRSYPPPRKTSYVDTRTGKATPRITPP